MIWRCPFIDEWKVNHITVPSSPMIQKNWDNINIKAIKSQFTCTNREDSARFLASQSTESNAWLNVLPSKVIGTLFNKNVFRISLTLRYGCDICVEHECPCNKAIVNPDGIHGLSCSLSAGRYGRHAELNKIMKLALAPA